MAYQILIVDDDREFRHEMCECLRHYKIIEASSGTEALQILKKPNAIDLVILDVVMPGLLGTEVLKQIRKKYLHLPIIILTGQSSKDVAIEALKGHATDYIEKPFEVTKFLHTIQKVLDLNSKSLTVNINKMEHIKSFIERNFDKKISLKDIANEACLSPKYLSRLFKETTGVGFNEYRLKIKLEKAAVLLKTTNTTVDQLSHDLGYKNPESFIRMFEKLMKTTPSKYRLTGGYKKRKSIKT